MQRLSKPGPLAAMITAFALGACAVRAVDVRPQPTDPALYAAWTCDAVYDEIDRVQQRAADVAYAVDGRSGNNIIVLGIGLIVFWPALLAMRGDGPEAAELAELKGRYEALQQAASRKACPAPPDVLSAEQAAALPVAVGERLVYEERAGDRGRLHEFGLTLTALHRGQLEFAPDLAGKPLDVRWLQDSAGNPAPLPPALRGIAPLSWARLLKRGMGLGDVLAGDVRTPDGGVGQLRGQVIAVGVQTSQGRPFDAAVVELFGDVPTPDVAAAAVTARVDGVMVVDRKSGVLLRLELRSANPEFALRRTLLRVEPRR